MADELEMERRVLGFRRATEQLHLVKFGILQRPQPGPEGRVTRLLVNWSIQFYSYSLLCHFREMMRSFLFLGDGERVPAGFLVCRSLFEMGAHAHYVHKHVQQFIAADDLGKTWEFLYEINMGSRYLREIYEDDTFATPRHIAKVISCFDEWTGHAGKAIAEYSFLSEFAHPNMGAFSHYYELRKKSPADIEVDFSRNFTDEPLPDVSAALVSTLHFSMKLLEAAGESEIASTLKAILSEFAEFHEPLAKLSFHA